MAVMVGTEIEPIDGADYQTKEYRETSFWYIRDDHHHWLYCSPDHRLQDHEGFPRQAQDFEPGMIIVRREGNFEVMESSDHQRISTKIEITMQRVHLYWANGFLSYDKNGL